MEEMEGEGSQAPSRLLWVGNVAAEASEALLIQIFAKYGAVDYVSAYPARSYAFIEFRDLEDAKEAKDGLQGRLVKGQSLRIEFARPAKPSRHLWIWGVSETMTKEQLEVEFKKFGPLEDFRLLRDRNSALAEFRKLQDASAAVKGLNKKHIQGEELRVDFLRSQSAKRGHTAMESFSQTVTDERVSKEGVPSETLWIGFPPPSRVDEEGLRKAFILFGEVERITTFPDRSYCFVQFRNVDEATRAKEGLQGRLLNDPRILIRFSSNEVVPKRTARPEGLYFPLPLQRGSVAHSEMGGSRSFGAFEWPGSTMNTQFPNRYSAAQHNINMKGFVRPSGGSSAGLLAAPLVRGGMPDARLVPSDGKEFFADNRLSSGDARGRPILEDPGIADRDYMQREHKRPNLGTSGYSEGYMESGSNFDARLMEGHGKAWMGANDPWQPNVHTGLHMYKGAQAGFEKGNTETPFLAGNMAREQGTTWKGSIAKAGVFVCCVQSFPVGKGIDNSLPGVVNCVARTSLDMLAQHFYQATDYGVIYFVPDGDSENGSFQEFVSYLGDKHRAGVANTSDGTTLFLVPPSDFAENVLKLHGDCLFGLVIKSRQVESSTPANYQEQPALPPVHGHQQQYIYSQPQTEESVLSTSTAGTMIPPSQSEGPPLTLELGYSSASLPRIRPHDDAAVSNGGGTPSKVESIENAPHDTESRVNLNSSVQDQFRSFQAVWSSPPGQTHPWDSSNVSSTSTNPNLQLSVGESPEARPSGGVEQVIANLQSASKDPTSATQVLLRQALLSQSGATDASAQDALKAGLIRRDGASEGEANNRFQATLQLAAALLQRMHNGRGSVGPTS
eukprot:c14462_g1_i1 orf=152-2680(+)